MSGRTRWICAQLGSREHYAIPRVLHRAGRLEALLTDFWATPRWLWENLPGRKVAAARERWHPDLAGARVHGLGWTRLAFDASNRDAGWETVIRRNDWFQERHLEWLRRNEKSLVGGSPGIFFSYSYAARGLLRFFKQIGWRTVLGQIDPGPREQEIVGAEAKRFPEWRGAWNPAPDRYWSEWREELELADLILVNSDWSLECLREDGVPEQRMIVVPLAYETKTTGSPESKSMPRESSRKRPLRVLFLGQVNLRKGAHHLLDAARRLSGLPVEFDFVGPVEIALPGDLPPNVRFHGPVSRDAASEFYSAADVFVLPTLSDGFALTQLEALARGVPVIATRNCGRVVEDGVNGWLLPSPSSEAISGLVTRLSSSPDEIARCRQEARVPESFSMTALGKALKSIERSLE